MRFTVTCVEERTRILSAHGHGENVQTVEQKYWCMVLDRLIAIDYGNTRPQYQAGDVLRLVKET